MINPFLKRATEYLRDEEAFLSIVSPEPVSYFLGPHGKQGHLFDRLVVIRGTPGSGKTTLAKLFEYSMVVTLLRNTTIDPYQTLLAALTEAGAIIDGVPRVLAYRLALERGYRDFWEFPYPDELKTGLMTSLIQARALLGWIRSLTAAGHLIENITIVPRPDAEAATQAIGGTAGGAVQERARIVEASIYQIVSALVAPEIPDLPSDATGAYRPFDVIERIDVFGSQPQQLTPLLVLDDAHELNVQQFRSLQHWLVRRELRVARWVLTRLDVMHPGEAIATVTEDRTERAELPGISVQRDITEILLQSGGEKDRKTNRMTFRRMAKDMADRYLRHMSLFNRKRLFSLSHLLDTEADPISESKHRQLASAVDTTARELRLTATRVETLRSTVEQYRPQDQAVTPDVRLAMLRILMHRYDKRTKSRRSLFDSESEVDLAPAKPVNADGAVFDAARLHLLHKYDRPFYTGIDDVCDAASENAEQFLKLAATLVEASAAQLIRSKSASLSANEQNKLLRRTASEILQSWNFPQAKQVATLVDQMANRCREESLQPNAWIGAGANAFGIPQTDLDSLPDRHRELARVLQYAVAYNAIVLVPRYGQGSQEWCLLELGGIPLLHYGLTLKRGGFIESTAEELAAIMEER